MKEYVKPIAVLFVIILFCSALVRLFSKSETLSEYAAKQPQTQDSQESSAPETVPLERQPIETDMTLPDSSDTDPDTPPSGQTETGPDAQTPSLADTEPDTRTPGQEGPEQEADISLSFYYEPLSEKIIDKITGVSYVENEDISLADLRYLHILHYNFEGESAEGELICNKSIAQDLLEIFYELYQSGYEIEKVRLIDEYAGDDTASMEDNNTSCFNYRVVDGSTKLSNHAYGLAIDINPFYNPYVVFQKDGDTYISPKGSEPYADRGADFPYKIDENDLCYKLFKEHGFAWGGNWNSCKDYQHFQKTP